MLPRRMSNSRRFADSPLEGTGFEPSGPPQEDGYFESAAEAGNDKPARYAALHW
jgi:hypothetical protein